MRRKDIGRVLIRNHNCLLVKNVPNLKEFMKLHKNRQSQGVTEEFSVANSDLKLKFHIETYGCQMNSSDSDIVRSVLLAAGHEACDDVASADVILTNTCAIRENAEAKVWNRLEYFQSLRNRNKHRYPIIGVLGCMAERLKSKLLEKETVDFVCGPDAYRDIPRLLESVTSTDQKMANTLLSLDETYADITPVRESTSCSAFVSIMRGCNNMCSFCIVPFTRGRERSRPMASILAEIRALADQGVREVVLLGQNVNGFHDTSAESAIAFPTSTYNITPGFANLYKGKSRDLAGARFADLLAAVADVHPELRVRFTSPHPKDFPDEVLELIAARPNICNAIHLPVQSGSSAVLARMRRGYSQESFLQLITRARGIIPGLTISTDIIAGFCGETEEEHQESLSIMRAAEFDQAFMFAYSLRAKTHAAHVLTDDVPESVKLRRLQEIIDVYRVCLRDRNVLSETGCYRLVLVEGRATKYTAERPMWTGRTDGNKRVVFPAAAVLFASHADYLRLSAGDAVLNLDSFFQARDEGPVETAQHHLHHLHNPQPESGGSGGASSKAFKHEDVHNAAKALSERLVDIVKQQQQQQQKQTDSDDVSAGPVTGDLAEEQVVGRYVVVRVLKAAGPTLRGVAVSMSSIAEQHALSSSSSSTAMTRA